MKYEDTLQEIRIDTHEPAQLQIPVKLEDIISHDKPRHRIRNLLLLSGLLAIGGVGWLLNQRRQSGGSKEVKPARLNDLTRLAGTWYEIARMPGQVEEPAVDMRVTYSLRGAQELSVEYAWRQGSFEAPEQREEKKLRIENLEEPARMKKQLMGALEIDYWLLEIGRRDDYVVFGTPSHQHVWILSRSPQLDEKRYVAILNRLQQQGFDIGRLERVQQMLPVKPGLPSQI